ncbi:MAG TPA: hypothetical protein VK206_09735 [Anaerolineales bacterium]|nr:hypothetical protein [Anaerolineales bacterium]
MMKQTMQKLFKHETFVAALLILLTTAITYGMSIPHLGYYYDDWYLLWSGQTRGAGSLISFFSTDRPFMGVVYSYVYRLLGESIVNWHLYALLWRLIGGLAFFWILRLTWPKHKYMTTLMAVLFVVYPGFLSQPDAATKENHLFGFGTGLLSIAFMLQGLKTSSRIGKTFYSLISIVLTANYLFIYEYMIGLEGMRLALLGFTLFQNDFTDLRTFLKNIVRNWWPYPLVMAGFLYWRLFIFEGSRNATDATQLASSYRGDLLSMSVRLILESFKDFLDTTLFAWFVEPFHLYTRAGYSGLLLSFLVAGIIIALVWLYSLLFKKWWGAEFSEADTPTLTKNFMGLGALITLCAIVPVVLSAREFDPTDAYKSYGLHPSGGVILWITGLILLLRPNFRKWGFLILIAISVSTQLLNAMNWARYWDDQREAWWQLTWRAPDIRNNTLVIAYFSNDFSFQQDYEIWGPVNLIYRQGQANFPRISAEVLNEATALNILRGDVLGRHMRDFSLPRDFTKLLLISLPSENSCIHVIDGTLPIYSEYESLLIRRVGTRSLVKRILPEGKAPVPPAAIFGTEPAHNWCFYYQRASLARQTGDWKEIGRLYDQTVAKGLRASDKSEVFPFLEGLVNSGRYDDARKLAEREVKGRDMLIYDVCESLAKDPGYPLDFKYNYAMLHQILCEP